MVQVQQQNGDLNTQSVNRNWSAGLILSLSSLVALAGCETNTRTTLEIERAAISNRVVSDKESLDRQFAIVLEGEQQPDRARLDSTGSYVDFGAGIFAITPFIDPVDRNNLTIRYYTYSDDIAFDFAAKMAQWRKRHTDWVIVERFENVQQGDSASWTLAGGLVFRAIPPNNSAESSNEVDADVSR